MCTSGLRNTYIGPVSSQNEIFVDAFWNMNQKEELEKKEEENGGWESFLRK